MTDELDPTGEAREHLATIRRGWRHVLDPIQTTGSGSVQGGIRPATEDDVDLPPDARYDTPVMLAFWVRAAIGQWPAIVQTLEPDHAGNLRLVTTVTVDCGNVPDMVDLLDREADRLATWVDDNDHDFGRTFRADLERHARAVSRIAWPPKGDRLVIGDCPTCGRRVRVKAPAWRRLPQPTTNPDVHPLWSWQPDRDKPIACRCGVEDTIEGWRGRIVSFEEREPKTAAQLVGLIAAAGHARYRSPAIVRQWARQGLIVKVGTSSRGESLFDPVQVLAALTDREKRRDQEAS